MGIVLSVVISYAGIHEVIECLRHLVSGVVPYEHPGFDDLVEHYTRELQKSAKQANDWTTASGQGYLYLKEDKNGKLSSADIKYYHNNQPDSAAILFSTKISSFGDFVDEPLVANSDYRKVRYSPSKTKTLVLNTNTEAQRVPKQKKSGADTQTHANSFDRREPEDTQNTKDTEDNEDKLTWQYTPLDTTPEIHFQTYADDKPGFFTEDYLRLIIDLDTTKHISPTHACSTIVT